MIGAAAVALVAATAAPAQPNATLDETVAYILRHCDGYVKDSYDNGKLSAMLTTRMRIEGDMVTSNMTIKYYRTEFSLNGRRYVLPPKTSNWERRFDINNVSISADRGNSYGRGIEVRCLSNVVANERGCFPGYNGKDRDTWFLCANRDNTLRAFKHFQQLRGGELKPDDPFAAR